MSQSLKRALFSALLVILVSYPILGLKLRTVGIKLEVLGADAQTLWTIAAAALAMFVWQLFRDRIPAQAGSRRRLQGQRQRPEELPQPAIDPALGGPRPGRGGFRLAVLRLARGGGHRHPDPDLRDARHRPEHRGRPGRPARSRLRRLLRGRCLHLRAARRVRRVRLLDRPADRRDDGRAVRLPPRLPGAAPARRLPGDRDPRLRRDHPHPAAQHDRDHRAVPTASARSPSRPCSA
ncbi:leucine/isoleucine/valine transporter permease subunit [Pseudomonas aeruginosa]|nr:leucine/isoleucine/valine transporter permease subunit [Pseudomonas aeruginosa]